MMLIYTTLVKGSVRFCILHAHYNTCGTHSQCRPGRPSATFGSSLPQITERWIAGPAALADSFADKYSLLTSLHGPEDNTTPIHVAHRTRPVKIPTSVLHRSPTHPHKSSAVARNHNQKSLRLHAVPLMQWLWVHTPSPPLHVQPQQFINAPPYLNTSSRITSFRHAVTIRPCSTRAWQFSLMLQTWNVCQPQSRCCIRAVLVFHSVLH